MMALTFVAGSRKFELSGADVQRYPDSMLHRLLDTVDAVDGPLTLQVANVPGSPLATWPGAMEVTVAVYKKKPLALTTLNDLLAQHTEAQLYDNMVSLLDFLAVPEPPEAIILQLLPSRHTCMRSFLHAGVLHTHVLTRQTADLIMWAGPVGCWHTVAGSSVLNTICPTAAFFFITLSGPVQNGRRLLTSRWASSSVRVYAVSSDCWPVQQQLSDDRNFEPGAIVAGRNAKAVELPSKPPEGDHTGSGTSRFMGATRLSTLMSEADHFGTAVGAHQDGLGSRVATVLREAVRGVSVDGRASAIKVSCIPRFRCGGSEQPLWVLHW